MVINRVMIFKLFCTCEPVNRNKAQQRNSTAASDQAKYSPLRGIGRGGILPLKDPYPEIIKEIYQPQVF